MARIANSVISGYRTRPQSKHAAAAIVLSKRLNEVLKENADLRRQVDNSSAALQTLIAENEQHEGVIETLCAALEVQGGR